jgi:diacylglycerol kinase
VALLNSAIEAASDRIGQDAQALSGIVKIMDAAAAFVTPCAIEPLRGAVIFDQSL